MACSHKQYLDSAQIEEILMKSDLDAYEEFSDSKNDDSTQETPSQP